MQTAQVGPLTAVTEALATAAGAGAVLGSVAVGIWGLTRGLPRSDLEAETLAMGYFGGGLGAFLACIDAFLRYI
jgi:hypothetical protein